MFDSSRAGLRWTRLGKFAKFRLRFSSSPSCSAAQRMHVMAYLNRTLLVLIVLASAGCTSWQARNWDMSHLRDARATALDARLSAQPQAVESPFSKAE